MTATATPRTYRLVALELGRTTQESLPALHEALRPALVAKVTDTTTLPGGRQVTRHTFTLYRDAMRDTVAHGYGYQAGFVVHVES